jgi:hypothetical protein
LFAEFAPQDLSGRGLCVWDGVDEMDLPRLLAGVSRSATKDAEFVFEFPAVGESIAQSNEGHGHRGNQEMRRRPPGWDSRRPQV